MDLTRFASPIRDDQELIYQYHQRVMKAREFVDSFNSLPEAILLLTVNRQAVFANEVACCMIGSSHPNQYLGKRPGELLHCCHSCEMPAGCGCSESCRVCGAVSAILEAIDGISACEECRINNTKGDALDLRVWARPINIDNIPLILLVVRDISHEKRRSALERIFFHDITDTAAILRSYQQMIADGLQPDTEQRFKQIACQLTDRLMDEIQQHRVLLNAEQKELNLNLKKILLQDLLNKVSAMYEPRAEQEHKQFIIECRQKRLLIQSDSTLIQRVLGNMIKNALEASEVGDSISLTVEMQDQDLLFKVHNQQVIPRDVQLQLFQRSFSTKGKGRGLGTYSMRLLGERYLKGRILLHSSPELGTTFTFSIPVIHPDA